MQIYSQTTGTPDYGISSNILLGLVTMYSIKNETANKQAVCITEVKWGTVTHTKPIETYIITHQSEITQLLNDTD